VPNPFESPGAWLRCALHAHTTASDGELAPELLVAHYGRAGFDVLAVTDHWVRTAPPASGSLVVVPSVELDALVRASGRVAHVLALGVSEAPARPSGELPGLEETVAWVNENGGVAFLAHPYWSGLSTADVVGCAGLAGLEVYNAGCELEVGRGLASLHWDEVLERRRPCLGIATDDSHHPAYDSSLAWVWARCAERSAESVLDALRHGSFYSSTGPKILMLAVEDGAVEVRCTPAQSVTLLAGRRRGARANAGRLEYPHRAEILERDAAGEIVAARLERPAGAPYGRLEVADGQGRTAWTNPLWI
jgi:predicted metal-dependent phosphoesterase TrpH